MQECVATIVVTRPTGSPEAGGTAEAAADAAEHALGALGARLDGRDWLAPGIACDIRFAGLDPDQADAAARSAIGHRLGAAAVDIVAQPFAARRKQLLVADMESTVIANEMLDEIGGLLGLGQQVAPITRRAMNGEIDFADALRQRVALLAGVPTEVLERAASRIRIMPGAPALVATMRANGAETALVSGGFRLYTSRVRDALGFDLDFANDLAIDGERLTGKVREPILDRDGKLAILKRLAADRGLGLAAALAIGDGANDLPMIEAAGLGVAFRAKPAVAARARARIDHADLRSLLYVQGYRQSEIVDPTGDG